MFDPIKKSKDSSPTKRIGAQAGSTSTIGLSSGLFVVVLFSLMSFMPGTSSAWQALQVRNGVRAGGGPSASATTGGQSITPRTGVTSQVSIPGQTVIDFDHDQSGASLSAPCLFVQTTPIREQYALLGVHFSGPDASSGGAILDQCSNFGVSAASGTNFLAFNATATYTSVGTPASPETITFDSPVSAVSMLASGGFTSSPGQLTAFGMTNNLLAADSEILPQGSYVTLQVSSGAGIRKVVLTGPSLFVVDNLSFSVISVFDTCLMDDHGTGFLQFSSVTGAYRFNRCSDGFTLSGVGTIRLVNGIETVTDSRSDRRISAGFSMATRTGSAVIMIQIAQGVWQTLRVNDTNPSATCTCF